MFGPLKRKEACDEKDRKCIEGCCTPLTYCKILGIIFVFFWVWGLINLLFLSGDVCTTFMEVESCISVDKTAMWIQLAINSIIVALIVMAWLKPEALVYKSVLSYICDVALIVSAVFMVIAVIALFSVSVGSALITLGLWSLGLWFNFWSCGVIREAVFRQKYCKGETFGSTSTEYKNPLV